MSRAGHSWNYNTESTARRRLNQADGARHAKGSEYDSLPIIISVADH